MNVLLRFVVIAWTLIVAYWLALLAIWCPWPVLLGLIIWVIWDAKNEYARLITARPGRN